MVTPAGEVEVTGTCFRVTADVPGRPGQGGAADQVTATWVEVMEGAVILRNGQGEVGLRPGERGRGITLGPSRFGCPGATIRWPSPTPWPMRHGCRHTGVPVAAGDDADARPGGLRFGRPRGRRRRSGPLLRLLDRGTADAGPPLHFRWSLPRHLTHFAALDFKEVPLQPDQRAAIARLMEQHRQEFLDDLRTIYMEVVGDRQTVDRLTALGLYQEIDAKSLREDGVEARRLILREWAGTATPPADIKSRPSIERMWRMLVASTDEIVRRMEPVVGRDDARRIGRAILDVRVSGTEPDCPSGSKTDKP